MLDTYTKNLDLKPIDKCLEQIEDEFKGQDFKYNENENWGIQILQMEIMNSSEPKIEKLIEFLNTEINGFSVWDSMKPRINVHSKPNNGKWFMNKDGNYECVVEFHGSPVGKERTLFNSNWFKGVDIDFYFDTRRTLGHTSFRWQDEPSLENCEIINYEPVEKVRHFTSKAYFNYSHLKQYRIFYDFIENPNWFVDDFDNGYFHNEKIEYHNVYCGDTTRYFQKKENIQMIKHLPNYTPEEFEKSYAKLVDLNTIIRPALNEKNCSQLFKYHNCIKSWILHLKMDEMQQKICF